MKTQIKSLFSAALFLLAGTIACLPVGRAFAQSDAEEVPGDNFSLEGALELFKKSASPQEFEQLLNSPNSKVNNLDLNGDGETDYIRVVDKNEGNVHAFILSAVVSSSETQDVAVIELEKRNDGTAVLQIVGDADIYGIETIIEPTEEVRVNAGTTTSRTVVNVWAWPSVQYVYGPYYSVWASPWYWGYYPGWYRPWRPVAYYVYDPFWAPYRPYYSVCYRHRIAYAPVIYRPYRRTSVIVYNRHSTQINNFRNTSHGYRHDRGEYARGSGHNRYAGGQRSRGDYDNASHGRSDYNSRSTTRSEYNSRSTTRSDYNRNRSTGDFDRNRGTNGVSRSRSTNDVRRSPDVNVNRDGNRSNGTRSFNRSEMNNRSTSHNNSGNSGIRQFSAPAQRQYSAPAQRHQSQPQFRTAPQQQHRSAPSARPNGGGSGSTGSGHGRRH
jgi:hypothetical protein